MTWYTDTDDAWTTAPTPAADRLSIRVAPDTPPLLQFRAPSADDVLITGTDPRPSADTTHTVVRYDPSAAAGTPLFTVHADGQDLVFEEDAPAEAIDADVYDHARSALTEIMIPVYIDDVVSDISERLSGLVAVHTTQYAGDEWTYFRAAVFENGTLLLEDEHGEL
jgi:hypothetical protein